LQNPVAPVRKRAALDTSLLAGGWDAGLAVEPTICLVTDATVVDRSSAATVVDRSSAASSSIVLGRFVGMVGGSASNRQHQAEHQQRCTNGACGRAPNRSTGSNNAIV
jgi:hypothetical protein